MAPFEGTSDLDLSDHIDTCTAGKFELFENVCSWCSERWLLPFDLRANFVCQDAGFTCSACAGGRRLVDRSADRTSDDDVHLFVNTCMWCGEIRLLPFEIGEEFVCGDVELKCSESSSKRPMCKDSLTVNRCGQCGCERHLPFDFGEDFTCEDAGFDCELTDEDADSSVEAFDNICARCGALRSLPFDLRSNFVCGDAGLPCQDQQDQEMSANVCVNCGETQMCPFSMSEGFVCGQCNLAAKGARRFEEVAPPPAPDDESSSDDGLDEKTREALRKANQRTQLLWKVLLQDMSMPDAAKLFLENGHEPPDKEELLDLRSNTLENFKKKSMGARLAAKSALKNKNKSGAQRRYLNNELVQVAKKDKYLHTPKESAEEKAKTSVELYIIGIGRGGRHAVKIARDDKKKGPRSHK